MMDRRDDRIGSALRGENPTVLKRLPSGFAVIGDTQFLPGYFQSLAFDASVELPPNPDAHDPAADAR